MRKLGNFLAGLVAGAIVGGVAALLLAPYSGEKTRNEIQTRVELLVEEGRRAALERRAELEAQLEALKSGKPATVEQAPE